MTYPAIICTVDVLLFTLKNGSLCVGLHRRTADPYANTLALPGGFIRADSDVSAKAAALRVLRDKVGSDQVYIEQLATFSGADRDPRGYSVSIAYIAAVPQTYANQEGLSIEWVPVESLTKELPFKHNEIIDVGVQRLKSKGLYSTLPMMFFSDRDFTLPELQVGYEVACGIVRDKVTFRRKMLDLGILEESDAKTQGKKARPATLYRIKPEHRLELSFFERTFSSS